jgi:hypothetical protein
MDENAGYVSLKLAEKLLPLPLTDEKVDVVSANIDRMQDRMGQRCPVAGGAARRGRASQRNMDRVLAA